MCKNKRVTIKNFTKNLYYSYFQRYLFYYYRVCIQYVAQEKNAGHPLWSCICVKKQNNNVALTPPAPLKYELQSASS